MTQWGEGELNCVWDAEHTSQELGYYLIYTFSVTTSSVHSYV